MVSCYHDLSKRLGIALRHEEYRCQFLSTEAKIMLAAHDEVVLLHYYHAKCACTSVYTHICLPVHIHNQSVLSVMSVLQGRNGNGPDMLVITVF